jgi:hypothetical protein
MDSKAIDARFVSPLRLAGEESRIHLEKNVVKACTEIGAIDRVMPRRFRVVNVLALGAVQLDVRMSGLVVLAHREEMLRFAYDPRTLAKYALLVLFHLHPAGSAG